MVCGKVGKAADDETFCSVFDVIDAVAEFVESVFAEVAVLGALVDVAELPHTLSNSLRASSRRVNSSCRGTPCGA